MKVQIKILNKEFYRKDEQLLSHPPKDVYDLPAYATTGSAGLDLKCTEDVTIYPGETKMIHTGLAIWAGSNVDELYGQDNDINGDVYDTGKDIGIMGVIIPRSGKGANEGLVLGNLVGVIDEDYQGELLIAAWNRNDISYKYDPHPDMLKFMQDVKENDKNTIELKAGDRIAQLVFMPVIKCQWDIIEEFSNNTERGQGGYGSTGE